MMVVLDTNVLVSALRSPHHAPARILDLVLAGEIDSVVDDRIFAEYREVLARPKFSFEERAVEDVLVYLEQAGIAVVAPPLDVNLPDPDDIIFLEVAAAQALLVTGNLRHYPAAQRHAVVVLSPSAFLETWQQLQG